MLSRAILMSPISGQHFCVFCKLHFVYFWTSVSVVSNRKSFDISEINYWLVPIRSAHFFFLLSFSLDILVYRKKRSRLFLSNSAPGSTVCGGIRYYTWIYGTYYRILNVDRSFCSGRASGRCVESRRIAARVFVFNHSRRRAGAGERKSHKYINTKMSARSESAERPRPRLPF